MKYSNDEKTLQFHQRFYWFDLVFFFWFDLFVCLFFQYVAAPKRNTMEPECNLKSGLSKMPITFERGNSLNRSEKGDVKFDLYKPKLLEQFIA